MAGNVRAKMLYRAAHALGIERLRADLDVPMRRLQDWMAGREATPTDVFLRVLDVLGRGKLAEVDRIRDVSERSGKLRRRSESLRAAARLTREQAEELRARLSQVTTSARQDRNSPS